jgi:membrane fusion protein, heavy metal efflux system
MTKIGKRILTVSLAGVVAIAAIVVLSSSRRRESAISLLKSLLPPASGEASAAGGAKASSSGAKPSDGSPALDLSESQLKAIKLGRVGTSEFPEDKEAVGSISFADEQSVQVFPDYQGTIIQSFAAMGAHVERDQPLYTIKSPDLIQAESTLIGAAATFDLTKKELARVKDLPGVAQREVEQAISDEQTADGALKAARDAVRVFGKTDAEIDQMIASRQIDPALVVRSPISGQITSYNAPPGLLVQPGNPPPPYTVANLSIKWMLADVIESDVALLNLDLPVQVRVLAYPNRVFRARISKIYPAVDPNTHRATVRSEIEDPKDELRPGMLANFIIRVAGPRVGIAMPANGVVREPDGAMTVWVTTDQHRFIQRVVTVGLRRDDRVQILSGLRGGEMVVTDGAVFLSSMLTAPPTD